MSYVFVTNCFNGPNKRVSRPSCIELNIDTASTPFRVTHEAEGPRWTAQTGQRITNSLYIQKKDTSSFASISSPVYLPTVTPRPPSNLSKSHNQPCMSLGSNRRRGRHAGTFKAIVPPADTVTVLPRSEGRSPSRSTPPVRTPPRT